MENFKKRWEISKNWQLIHPILGLLASLLCGYLIAKSMLTSYTHSEFYYLSLGFLTVLGTIAIIKISLWCFKKLKHRWKVDARWEFIAIFLCFAVTGSTAGRLSNPLMELIGLARETTNGWLYWPLRIVLIFPIYQVILVAYGWLFGQSKFFTPFAKKMASRMGFGFLFR